MQTKTLNTIQIISKIAKILSTVLYVCSLVGAILCAVGIISLRFFPEGFKIGGTTIQGIIDETGSLSTQDLYIGMTTFLIVLAGEAAVCKIAETFFKNELKAGTPFTFEGAKELLRFGICAMVIPAAASLISQIVCRILFPGGTDALTSEFSVSSTMVIGAMLLAISLLCRHGAELSKPDASSLPNLPDAVADEAAE